ncbi:peptidoglycan glycosyltransferase PbpC [Xenorhabdus nematophila]|uniref:peptidoglycan glycosyltransferase PbpC n=1 Tax=Xenorhabdus nematophila TaxID=628 RepID=UPI000542636A|nr:peptidoglycan glycosyltransferase PbpC [Xenorhabdus nematophila]CEF32846.1 transglycosylase of penicillin-binding protein 1c [Xenorhabdus nematophila str. Websteri]AYA39470.1 penicillin-binding protein 1C [Xenorhabdus nematophila]KHD28453.1 penicillin-binding protein 1C [Xenorhabdus nematophila]MBA0018038.1 peptidoglycan glycosyltransferase PbpC [Xenorhabdus nematophila]MCB4424541.1 peptidoglycan glycosyltransferase PbpC [Xenorhabdus nematophila]
MRKLSCRIYLSILAILLIIPVTMWLADKIWPLPMYNVKMARVVVGADGSPLWRFADSEGIWRYPVTLDQVSLEYLQALLTYEDRWFYKHPGINPVSLLRAGWQDIRAGKIVSGGSTISMQVARLIDPHSRTFSGKFKQIWRTLQLEWHYSKDEILEMYLNRAPFGGTLQGIGAASWAYLGKPPSDLSSGEAALLAVLPQAPSRLRPDRYPERAQAARDKVLQRLAQYNVWSVKKVADIKEENLWLAPRQVPHLAPLLARRMVNEHHQEVIQTTIDTGLQRQLEDMVLNWKYQLAAKTSIGVLVVDHTDMSVKAYIGSVDFQDDSRFGHVDMISAWRSPGSTLKPFLYAMALDDGLIHAESLLQDVPRRFDDYRPGNFDSGFNGPVSASEALVRSLNLPAVQLLESYGSKRFTANLRHTGTRLRFLLGSEPNLSLILGGTSARMDQLVAAYSAFARQGKVSPLRFTPQQKVRDRQLFSAGAAWIVRRIMAGEGRPRPDNILSAEVPLAWKTGTSYGYRDAWAIGVNARYTIGVWVGRPDGTPVVGQFGYATAIPIMNQINGLLMENLRYSSTRIPVDPRPSSVSQATICWPGGMALPQENLLSESRSQENNNCRQRRLSWILDNTIPPTLSTAGQEGTSGINGRIWIDKKGLRVAPDCLNASPETVSLWPIALEAWLPVKERRIHRLPPVNPQCPPMKMDEAPLLIIGVSDGEVLKRIQGKKTLDLRVTTQGGRGQQWWFLNGEQIIVTENNQSWIKTISQSGRYQLTVLDLSGQVSSINFLLK